MINISRESEINLINILIDQDIISGKDLANIKKVSTEKQSSKGCSFWIKINRWR